MKEEEKKKIHDWFAHWTHAAVQVIDVRHFVLQAQESWNSYRLPASSYLYACKGQATVRLDGREYAADRFLLLHGGKGMVLDVKLTDELFVFYLILYKAKMMLPRSANHALLSDGGGEPFHLPYALVPHEPTKLYHLVATMAREWAAQERLRAKGTFLQFVHEVMQQLLQHGFQQEQEPLAKQVVRYLEEHYTERISLESLAEHFCYSARYLTRLVKEETGHSPIDYVISLRMEKAKELLSQTDATMQEVAASVGYHDVLYFSRLFKKHTGMTPTSFSGHAPGPDRLYGKPGLCIVDAHRESYSVNDNRYQRSFGGIIHMNKKSTRHMATLFMVSLALFVSACSGTASPTPQKGSVQEQTGATQRELTDGMGNKVTVPSHPQRIIATYLEDHLVALGVKPVAQWSVGKGDVQGYLQKDLAGIPAIPHDLPPEVVMSYNPDLIIMDNEDLVAGDKYSQYAKISPTYTIGKEKNSDWRKELLVVGEVLNKSEEAKKVLADYDAYVAESKQKLKQAIGDKTAAALWVTAKNIYVARQDLSSGDVLYKDLGFTVPAVVQEISKSGDANWNALSQEKLAQMDADYLFIVNSKGASKDEFLKEPVWANIPAVQKGQVYDFSTESSWLYTGVIANRQMIENVLENVVK
ncbi:AraC family transcriptional regulator [Brevibacillus sp. HD1.4A]|uniref:AraC family transcriptional regulator n=1 Tax=Brevibacillus sp. HD1.4A TaxID=2738978 RepID=UPI00156AEC0C|nr:AraC family transcriptional regulator [Brevibacillus sp. HD1.4A]NRQ51925.1 AraC family transcriptional regulator [Brevibacillus sp. HD1.4A]